MNTPPPGFAQYPRPQGLPSGLTPQPPGIHFSAINEASRLFQKDWATWVGTTLVAGVLYLIVFVPFFFVTLFLEFGSFALGSSMGRQPSQAGQLESLVTNLIPTMFSVALGSGMVSMALKQLRGQPIAVGDLFGSFRFAPRLLVMNLCASIPYALCSVAFGTPGIAIGALPCLWITAVLALAPFIAIDQDLGVGAAIGKSFRALSGIGTTVMMILFLIVVFLVYMLGGCACGVGILATVPICFLALALHYFYFFPEAFETSAPPSSGQV